MCRLCLFNAGAALYLGQENLEYHFAVLEQLQGGDGMGVAALWGNPEHPWYEQIQVRSSVDLGPREAASHIFKWMRQGATEFCFHTRFATFGSKRSGNCHPFKHNNTVMAHNGSDHQFTPIGDRTDSETILMSMVKADLPLSFLENVSGVFVGFRNSLPFVVKGQAHSSLWLLKRDNAWLFTSAAEEYVKDFFTYRKNLGVFYWEGTDSGHTGKETYQSSQYWEREFDMAWVKGSNEKRGVASKRHKRRHRYWYSAGVELAMLERAERTKAPVYKAPVSVPAKYLPQTTAPTQKKPEIVTPLVNMEKHNNAKGTIDKAGAFLGEGDEFEFETCVAFTNYIRDHEIDTKHRYIGEYTLSKIANLTGMSEATQKEWVRILNYTEAVFSTDELLRWYRAGKYAEVTERQEA